MEKTCGCLRDTSGGFWDEEEGCELDDDTVSGCSAIREDKGLNL